MYGQTEEQLIKYRYTRMRVANTILVIINIMYTPKIRPGMGNNHTIVMSVIILLDNN